MSCPRWKATFNDVYYSSGTVVATGNTGIVASTSLISLPGTAIFPTLFIAVGASMTTDETNDITIDWYGDSAGNGGAIGTTTFNQLTAGSLTDLEAWPGDFTAYNAARDLVPLPPYHKITHTLAGTTKSMSYIIYISYLVQV